MTLTLNGVHIGPDNAYIADKNGNVCDLTQIQTESGVFACSLYAKNTVSNLVINGYNTFEVPQVSRRLAKGGPEGHYGTRELGEKLERQELGLDPTEESYTDVTIDVQGFTEDMTVYSVDMEWGAMTFQYENTIWDATEHKSVAGAGWKVYDSVADKALDTTQDAVNQIKVTNYSNADVYATLDYAAEKTDDKDYSDTTGDFAKNAEDTDTQFHQKSPYALAYLTLGNADNGNGPAEGVGMPTSGTVFFMPSGIKEEYKPKDQIAKWSQIGTITVGIKTEKPGP